MKGAKAEGISKLIALLHRGMLKAVFTNDYTILVALC